MPQKVSKTTILRYLKIWLLNLRASVKKSNTYKGEMVVRLLRTVFLVGTQILLLTLVFGNQEMYVGWTKPEAYLVLGIWNILNYSGWALFGINLLQLEKNVLNGEFDFVLLKPLSSAWFSSFYDFSIYNFISALAGLVLVGYYFVVSWGTLTLGRVLLGVIGMGIGLVFWYAFYLFLASFTLANPRNGFLSIAKEILGLTRYPVSIYSNSIQFIFYTLLPIGFISTVPAELFIGRTSIFFLFIGAGLSIIFVRLSYWVWKQNVKKYVSAGG
jgi:ABC-2 type transport system permease protein